MPAMFEIIFLGTAAAAPTIHRNLTSQMVLVNEYRFLIDCGEGTQRQILKSGLGFKKLDKILLTHGHLDHILGLGGLVATLTRWENIDAIDVYGGQSTLNRVHNLLYEVVFMGQSPPTPIHLNALQQGIFFEDNKFSLRAFSVRHQGSGNFGYVFEEKTRRPFHAEKAEALGIPSGPQRGQLVNGQRVTLPDGRTIHPDDVLGDEIPGAKLVYIGDCGDTSNLHEVAADADCLIIEATYVDSEVELAQKFGHMTAGGAARFAREINAKALVLNHVSRRSREYELRKEAQQYFEHTIIARDFDRFMISKDRGAVKLDTDS